MKKYLTKFAASALAILLILSSMPTAIFAAETSSYDVTYLSADDTQKSKLSVKSKFENTNVETKFAADAFSKSKYLNLMNKVSWGKLALETKLGSHISIKAYSNDMSITGLCDGIIDSNSTESEKRFMQSSSFNSGSFLSGSSQQGYLTVFLGNTYDISSIYLMSHFKTRQALYDYELYVGNDKQNLYTADNLVIDYAYSGYDKNSDTTGKLNDEGLSEGQKFNFTGDKARGRYVGIKIIKGETVTGSFSFLSSPDSFWLSEFGIEGTQVKDDEYKVKFKTASLSNNTSMKVYSNYKNTQVVTKFLENAFETRCENNLLKDIKRDQFSFQDGLGKGLGSGTYDTEVDLEKKSHYNSIRSFADGKLIKKIEEKPDQSHEVIPHFYNYGSSLKNQEENINYKYSLTFDLQSNIQLSSFYLFTDYRANWAISKYDLFVSNDKKNLYTTDNLVVSYTYDGYKNDTSTGKLNWIDVSEGQEFIFPKGERPEGRYFGIIIYDTNNKTDPASWMMISELGFEGITSLRPDTSTVTDDVIITPEKDYGFVDFADYKFTLTAKNGAEIQKVLADGKELEVGQDGYYLIEGATRDTKLEIKTNRDDYAPVNSVYNDVDLSNKSTGYTKSIWEKGTQYLETSMFYKGDSKYGIEPKLSTRLAYPIDEVISVTSYDGATKYYLNEDYTIKDGEFFLTDKTSIPVYGTEEGDSIDDLALLDIPEVDPENPDDSLVIKDSTYFSKLIWKHQINITYTHSKTWDSEDYYNTALPSKLDKLPNFDLKTRIGENTNVLFIGDDITVGYGASAFSKTSYQVAEDGIGVAAETVRENSSSMFNDTYHESALPLWGANSFAGQIETVLNEKYDDCITFTYRGVKGSTSTWAKNNKDFMYTSNANSAATPAPDLVIISYVAYEQDVPASTIVSNIGEIITLLKRVNPECEFLLVSPLYTNNRNADGTLNNETLKALEEEFIKVENGTSTIIKNNENIVAVPNYSVFESLANQKSVFDYLADASTLPNDFGMNVYANNILRTLGCFECEHDELVTTVPADLETNGKASYSCKICKNVTRNVEWLYRPDSFKLSTTSYSYDGKVKTPTVTVKDSNGKTISSSNYSVFNASGRKVPGTYKVTVKFNGKYYKGTKDLYFKIVKCNISKCDVKLSYTSKVYTGKTITPPSVTVKANGTTLKKNTHYTVKYASGRKAVGKYKVTVTMKGSYYTGTKTLYLTINPQTTKVKKLTAKKKSLKVYITKKSKEVTGYQVQYSTSKKFSSAKTKTISKYKTTTCTLSKLKAKKTYYVRVRTYKTVKGKKYYSSWSSAKSKKTK